MIEVKDIEKIYRVGDHQIRALRGVSFHMEREQMVAVMGSSGSGKSTLMYILGCLDRPTSGTYFLEGTDVSSLSDDQLAEIRNRKIGFVFQTFNLLPRTTALENVELPLIYGGIRNSRKRAIEALERVGLIDRMHHLPSELSGGEGQRVAIARALVVNPVIILADEPTGNLDTKTGSEIMGLFKELNSQGVTVLIVTHEAHIAQECQRIIHLRDGQIVGEKT
ncbi:MAG TPA: ABC transporter ATP-binding protein [Syntrophaceae bacterium]|nr:ABC transporter ATP-binding protein [Syntrophaceae bacterium]